MQLLTFLIGALPLASAALFDSIEQLPRGWSFHRDADNNERINLKVNLRKQNLDAFEKLFWEISSPSHENYGKHMKSHEIASMTQPKEDSVAAVIDWLRDASVEDISVGGSWVSFTTTVGNANELLGTKFTYFKNDARGEARLRTTEYHVPSHIVDHINFVSPTLRFPSISTLSTGVHKTTNHEAVAAYQEWAATVADPGAEAPSAAVCSGLVTPQCLLQLYNVHYAASPTNSSAAFASFLYEYARYADLTTFENNIATYAKGKNFTVQEFNGGLNDQSSNNESTEANLDSQYLLSIAYPVPIIEYSTAGCGSQVPDPNEPAGQCDNEPYIEFLAGLSALPDSELPQTISVSYGDDEQTWPLSEATQICTEFMELGARGVSVLFASGDSGPGATCENNAGSKVEFVPNFPASCPYVTTVGATTSVSPEQAASFSGGGFSNYFAQPSYQSSAVSGYISKLNGKFAQYYNASGRAYPDVSAQGENFQVVDKGSTENIGGTSASTPTFSGVVALLNAARIKSGLAPLGFLNPLLYANPSALNDITTGTSSGCGSQISGAGFAALAGWDASTGLGTPNFGSLLAIVAPNECNVGGVIANPTMSSCSPGANQTSVSGRRGRRAM